MSILLCCSKLVNWDSVAIIATGLSAFATAIMACVALCSLLQNKKQLKELKKQREEDTRARLIFEIVAREEHIYLKITNTGRSTAYNIRLSIKSDLIVNHFSQNIKSTFEEINHQNLTMVPGRSIYYYISPIITDPYVSITVGTQSYPAKSIQEWNNQHEETPIYISGSYCGRYSINEKLSIMDFISYSILINDPTTSALTDIVTALSKANASLKEIKTPITSLQDSLTKIEKKIK